MSRPILDAPNYRLVRRTGRRKWYIAWTEEGETQLVSTGVEAGPEGTEPSPDAIAYLKRFIDKQNAPPPEPKVRDLMAKRLAHWTAKRPRKKPALARMKSIHGFINGFFGDDQPQDITPERVQAYHAHRGDVLTAITRELEELRTACVHATRHPSWGVAKAPTIEMPSKRPPRDVVMTRAQGKALLKAADRPHIKLFILLALTTGRRHGAILDLTWERVDLKRGILVFDNYEEQESKKRRGVCSVGRPVTRPLKKAHAARKTPYVIEYRGKRLESIKKSFELTAAAAGLPWVTAHICKHSVITWLSEADWSIQKISDFTDTDEATVKRIYKKVNPEYLGGLKDELSSIISGVSGTGGAKNKGSKRGPKTPPK